MFLIQGCAWSQDGFLLRKDIVLQQQTGPGWVVAPPVAGDFNNDGRPDLAICSAGKQTMLLNLGGGNFGPPVGSVEGCGMVAADFNGDGRLDLFAWNRFLFGRGDGTFLPASTGLSIDGPHPRFVASGDFNDDRKPDLVYYTSPDSEESAPVTIHVLAGAGDGTFRSAWKKEYPPGRLPFSAIVADWNRDGRPDLSGGNGREVVVLLGRGDGMFDEPIYTLRGEDTGTWIAGDFNRDGNLDLASPASLALGNGDGTFRPPTPHPTLPMVDGIFGLPTFLYTSGAADLNGDGHLDLAGVLYEGLPGFGGRQVWVLPGNGDGTLLPPVRYPVGRTASVIVADIDVDGRADLVAANFFSNSISLLFSRPQGGRNLNRAVSSASGTAILAAGSLGTIYGSTLANTTASAQSPWPTSLGGVQLEVRDSAGVSRPAFLLYVAATQINFQVPKDTAAGEATLTVLRGGESAVAGSMQVDPVAPGLFLLDRVPIPNPVAAAVLIRIEDDGTQTLLPLLNCSTLDLCLPQYPPRDGRPRYASLFGTGFRNAPSAPVSCTGNGRPLVVTYAGPQAVSGVDQINLALPDGEPPGLVICTTGGVVSNPVTLY